MASAPAAYLETEAFPLTMASRMISHPTVFTKELYNYTRIQFDLAPIFDSRALGQRFVAESIKRKITSLNDSPNLPLFFNLTYASLFIVIVYLLFIE